MLREIIKSTLNILRIKLFLSRYNVSTNCKIGKGVVFWAPKWIKIDRDVYIGSYSRIGTNTTIGRGTLISSYVSILGKRDHNMQEIGSPISLSHSVRKGYGPGAKEFVIIGEDVWIGHRSIILSGVNIANGTVIGAGSVVTHDTLSYGIYAGNPAKFIRWRFERDDLLAQHITKLEKE